ncbi:MAG: hypothetical protein ACK59Y_08490, partial [Betaproteobacteria bacterium]
LARIRFLQHRNDLGFSKSRLLHLNLLAIKTMPESSTFSWSGIQGSLRDDLDPLCDDLVNELHARLLGKGPGPRH